MYIQMRNTYGNWKVTELKRVNICANKNIEKQKTVKTEHSERTFNYMEGMQPYNTYIRSETWQGCMCIFLAIRCATLI